MSVEWRDISKNTSTGNYYGDLYENDELIDTGLLILQNTTGNNSSDVGSFILKAKQGGNNVGGLVVAFSGDSDNLDQYLEINNSGDLLEGAVPYWNCISNGIFGNYCLKYHEVGNDTEYSIGYRLPSSKFKDYWDLVYEGASQSEIDEAFRLAKADTSGPTIAVIPSNVTEYSQIDIPAYSFKFNAIRESGSSVTRILCSIEGLSVSKLKSMIYDAYGYNGLIQFPLVFGVEVTNSSGSYLGSFESSEQILESYTSFFSSVTGNITTTAGTIWMKPFVKSSSGSLQKLFFSNTLSGFLDTSKLQTVRIVTEPDPGDNLRLGFVLYPPHPETGVTEALFLVQGDWEGQVNGYIYLSRTDGGIPAGGIYSKVSPTSVSLFHESGTSHQIPVTVNLDYYNDGSPLWLCFNPTSTLPWEKELINTRLI